MTKITITTTITEDPAGAEIQTSVHVDAMPESGTRSREFVDAALNTAGKMMKAVEEECMKIGITPTGNNRLLG
jgi:hypothetical protein